MGPLQLRDWRRAHNLTQAELAGLLGVSPNSVARWERGELPIRHPELIGLAIENLGRRLADPRQAGAPDAGRWHNLPAEVNRFVGRERELAELVGRLREARLLTITGSGGVGKTRLALRVAASMLQEFADGVWVVELATIPDDAQVASSVANALTVREQPGRPIWASIADSIGGR